MKPTPSPSPSPYKGRKPSLIRNLWIYRRLVALACVLGLMLWFIWANDTKVTVQFPFGLGVLTSTTGLVILLSALVGSAVTALAMTVVFTLRQARSASASAGASASAKPEDETATTLPDDLPPPNYAAKTEGFSEKRWS
jgi:uncharacterized integral membrane protein